MSWHQILILNQSCIARSTTDRLCHCGDCVSLTRRTQGPGRLIATLFNCQSLTHSLLLTMTYDKWLSSVWLIDSLIQWNDFSIQIYFHFIMTLHSGWRTVTVSASFDAGLLLPVPVSCSDRFRLKFTSLNEWKLFDDDNYHSSFSSFSLFCYFIVWLIGADAILNLATDCCSEEENWLIQFRNPMTFTGMMNQCMAGNHCRIMTHWTIREIILKWSNNNNCMYGL